MRQRRPKKNITWRHLVRFWNDHVNKQKYNFSSVLQQNVFTKEFIRFDFVKIAVAVDKINKMRTADPLALIEGKQCKLLLLIFE